MNLLKKVVKSVARKASAVCDVIGKHAGKAAAVVTGLFVAGKATVASAQTDITTTITAVSGYVTAAIAVGVTVMLFVIGRAVVRKLAK